MAKKKRGPGRPPGKKNTKQAKPQHILPEGFWSQVMAVLLIVFALILLFGLFNFGGTFPTTLAGAIAWLIGWTAFILPFLLVVQAVQIFRAEENRLSPAVWVATILFVFLTAGLFQLLLNDFTIMANSTDPLWGWGGGAAGWLIDSQLLGRALDPAVMALVLLVFDAILLLFVLSVSPKDLLNGIKSLFGNEETGGLVKGEKAATATNSVAAKAELKKPSELKINNTTEINDSKKTAKTKADKDDTAQRSLVASSDPNWEFPSLDLLNKKTTAADPGDVAKNAKTIEETLEDYGINATPQSVNVGPRVTQYTLLPARGTQFSNILKRERELKANLEAKSIRIEAPIPGKKEIGIEIQNKKIADVNLYNMMNSEEWKNAKGELNFTIGRDTSNHAIIGDLADMRHLLIAGTTGSGKSVMVNSLLCSLLYKNSPSDLRLIMVDPKMVELTRYKDIPHLITPIITDCATNPQTTVSALRWAVDVMDNRYKEMADEGVTAIKAYNEKMAKEQEAKPNEKTDASDEEEESKGKMPYIVIVVDEVADLMMSAGREVEELIVRLLQKGRAAGIHVVLATQSPRKDVITGLIKANVPATIVFAVKNHTESQIAIGNAGAEKLLGKGDMLLQTLDAPSPKRIQGAFVSNGEVSKITHAIRLQAPPNYDPDVIKQPVQLNGKGAVMFGGGGDSEYEEAKRIVISNNKGSTSLLSRRMNIGYGKAARFLDQMEEEGIVGPSQGSKGREVLVSSLDED